MLSVLNHMESVLNRMGRQARTPSRACFASSLIYLSSCYRSRCKSRPKEFTLARGEFYEVFSAKSEWFSGTIGTINPRSVQRALARVTNTNSFKKRTDYTVSSWLRYTIGIATKRTTFR